MGKLSFLVKPPKNDLMLYKEKEVGYRKGLIHNSQSQAHIFTI